MASESEVRKYIAYWFQLGKKVLIRNGSEGLLPKSVNAGDRYSNEFEECWQKSSRRQRRLLPARHKRNNCPTADTSMGNQCLRALRYARSAPRFWNGPGVLSLLRFTELARYRNAPTSIARVHPIAIVRNSR